MGGPLMSTPFNAWLSTAAYWDVLGAAYLSPSAMEGLRQQRLQALLQAAMASPFYRERLAARPPSAWRLEDLPIVSKPELMRRFDDWLTDRSVRLADVQAFIADRSRIGSPLMGRYLVWASSGSSGEPGIFVQDPRALAVYDALQCLRQPQAQTWQRWLDPWFGSERVALIVSTDEHAASTVWATRLRQLNPALQTQLHVYSFLLPPERLVAELNALQPSIISTYPTAALQLAKAAKQGRLCVRAREVWTGGESQTAAMRAYIAQAFGARVVDNYGASEFFNLACECRLGALHLNSDWAILESVDEQGRQVPAEHIGARTLLTNLANHVQPIIRYELGDRVRILRQPCACGSHLPRIEVHGRCDDLLELPDAHGGSVSVLPLALTTVIEQEAQLFDFQLVQLSPLELALHAGSADAGPRLRRAATALRDYLKSQGVVGVQVRSKASVQVHTSHSGKTRRVVALPPAPAVAQAEGAPPPSPATPYRGPSPSVKSRRVA